APLPAYNKLESAWWKWALSQPRDRSPLVDSEGRNCQNGQSLDPRAPFFLAGVVDQADSGKKITRTCIVPHGRNLFFPVVNLAYFAFPDDPPEQKTEAFIRAQAAAVEAATALSVTIDGSPAAYSLVKSADIFRVVLPANNIYGLPTGFVFDPSVDEGYYVGALLLPGVHSIHIQGTLNGFVVDVTYTIIQT
ncbi:MAG TPA: hypothetical protein VHM19_16980, partial [Polyangiales bacterium]|nr:hypothetical protein [Polyangiales bacterium]